MNTNTTATLPKSITILGRRWFQSTYGNTYHTAEIYVDGEMVHKTPMQYGYGDQYEQTGMKWLEGAGYLPGYREAKTWPRLYCEQHGIAFTRSVSDVSRQKDL